jgi:hypothetical protein
MTQADSVLSTPPTNTPVDTTRRRFLAVAAVVSVAGAGSLTAAATLAPEVPQAVTVPHVSPALRAAILHDPVFGLIEAHRKAGRDHEAALVEQERLERIGDKAAADLAGEAPCHAEFNALDVLLAAQRFPVSSPSWPTFKTSRSAMRGCSMTARAAQPA